MILGGGGGGGGEGGGDTCTLRINDSTKFNIHCYLNLGPSLTVEYYEVLHCLLAWGNYLQN
jgi:hypothetical protein